MDDVLLVGGEDSDKRLWFAGQVSALMMSEVVVRQLEYFQSESLT